MSAAKVCDGMFRYAPEVLEKLAEGSRFRAEGGESGYMGKAVEIVESTREKGFKESRSESPHCRFGAKPRGRHFDLTTSYYGPSDVDSGKSSTDAVRYDLGESALVGYNSAELLFECISPRLEGSRVNPARIRMHIYQVDLSDDDAKPRDVYLKLAHSAALSVARELECENDGGLPERLVPRRVK
ncbi:hypothetical protein [Streptomyces sp. NPDC018031]|uniref:hypothetical protein n=1 Tax=Streptomyces sp. NPDC018031 TaxID=3365033 RepID=UPI00379AF3EE